MKHADWDTQMDLDGVPSELMAVFPKYKAALTDVQ
jgi:hypothetical protein